MPIYIIVFLFLSISLLLVLSAGFSIYLRMIEDKEKRHSLKGTIIVKIDLFNRTFLIEPLEFRNRKILQSHRIVKGINWKEWNKINLILDRFGSRISKKIAEVFNKLERGSLNEYLKFKAPSFYTKNRNVQYDFHFSKIPDSNHFIVRINYNHIMVNSQNIEDAKIKEVTRLEIANNEKKIKGFVAFNINTSINHAITRFREIIQFRNQKKQIAYLRYNAILVFVIFANKNWQIQKAINKIKKQAESSSFFNELKYLYKGSAIAKTQKIHSVRYVNKMLQSLNFLAIYSMKKNIKFLSVNKEIDRKFFKTYNHALRIFESTISNKNFKLSYSSIRNIGNNKPIVDFLSPVVQNINSELFSWIISDMRNQTELQNSFAEKMLFKHQEKPIIVDVNDTWLFKNVERIKNTKALVAINFRNMAQRKTRVDLIRKVNHHNIAFALYIHSYNDNKASFLKLAKPRFVVVDDNIWTKNKLLSSDHFLNLISLNSLAKENKIKIIYKNPSLILDKKIYSDIGLKYYFQV